MQTLQGFKSGQGWMTALLILAGLDVVIGAIGALFMVSAPPSPTMVTEISQAGMVLFFQIPLRCISLVIAMRWTWRLVANAHRQGAFPVSPQWAWLGYVVPFVAFWLPLKSLLVLNGTAPYRRILICAWWLVRFLTTTFTGAFFLAAGFGVAFAVTGAATERFAGQWMETIILGGLIARILEIAVITLTQAHQPRAQVVAATVF